MTLLVPFESRTPVDRCIGEVLFCHHLGALAAGLNWRSEFDGAFADYIVQTRIAQESQPTLIRLHTALKENTKARRILERSY